MYIFCSTFMVYFDQYCTSGASSACLAVGEMRKKEASFSPRLVVRKCTREPFEREHDCQHLFFNLGVSCFSFSQGTTCIGDWFSLLQQCSSKTLLTCITLYLERCFWVIIAEDCRELCSPVSSSPLPLVLWSNST